MMMLQLKRWMAHYITQFLLEKKTIGRVTFLPMQSWTHQQEKSLEEQITVEQDFMVMNTVQIIGKRNKI